jgi:DNA-directed RNA polymerase sigma subunit (sigma70/sigma32)
MSRTEENIAKVHQIVRENHRSTVRSIAEQANIDKETVREILTAKMVPKQVTEKQKQSQNLSRPFGEARLHFGPSDEAWVD